MSDPTALPGLAVIGGGPAGLMAAETARAAGIEVDLYEAKGSVGRKFLIAGKGGLNLTHGEERPGFDRRYRERSEAVGAWLDDFDAAALREWARGLGVETYVGSSGRVFPLDRKAAPLLRGYGPGEPVDREALVEMVHRVSSLIDDIPEVRDLACDPILAAAAGATVVEARLRIGAEPMSIDLGPRRLR